MKILATIGALAIVVAVVAGGFFFGGFYNVAGTAEDPAIVKWALIQVRTNSIFRHAKDTPPVNIADPANVQAGAQEFAEHGCANCHGAPGVKWAKFSEGIHPDPPDLKDVVNDRTPAQLFWVIKNGINMTGMPSFALAGATDDDLWKIVAFLKKLPTISEADYKTWTAPPTPPSSPPAAAPTETPAPAAPQAPKQ
ncbi:MAG TPA: cytochrome c [Pseudolabrys sp.]|jgi:mono/diheme cytochrome c family protein